MTSLSRIALALTIATAGFTPHVIAQQPFDSQSLAQGKQTNAPRTAAPARPAPRTVDGKPDLSGFWRGPLLRNMDKNVPGGFKAIFTPAGAAAYERNRTKTINPEGLCLFAGIPRASISGVPFQIVQACGVPVGRFAKSPRIMVQRSPPSSNSISPRMMRTAAWLLRCA